MHLPGAQYRKCVHPTAKSCTLDTVLDNLFSCLRIFPASHECNVLDYNGREMSIFSRSSQISPRHTK